MPGTSPGVLSDPASELKKQGPRGWVLDSVLPLLKMIMGKITSLLWASVSSFVK